MSTINEKQSLDTNVLTVTRPTPIRQGSSQYIDVLSTIEDVDSTHSLTPTHTSHSEKSTMFRSSPFNDSKAVITPTITDLEAGLTPQQTTTKSTCSRAAINGQAKGDSAWPTLQELHRQRKERKRLHANCVWWAAMSKKRKLTVKIGVALLITALIAVMAVLVSKAVGGGVWRKGATNAPIST